MPPEESQDDLLIMCIDPESVRAAHVVASCFRAQQKLPTVSPHKLILMKRQVICLGWTGCQCPINQMLADMDAPTEHNSRDDPAFEPTAADNELVKFVNKVIIDARNQEAFDVHIEQIPGKIKTGFRFRIDGTLQP